MAAPRTPPKPPSKPAPSGSAAQLASRRGSLGPLAATVGLGAAGALLNFVGGAKLPDPFKGGSVNFPDDLHTQIGHYVEFMAQETKPLLETGILDAIGLGGSKINGGTIRLPMPSQLSTDYNPEWSPKDLGVGMAGQALSAADRALYGSGDVTAAAAAGGAAMGAFYDKAKSGITTGLAAVGISGGDAGAALKVGAGLAENPHKVLLFTGVNFREHKFSWRLSPRNRNESNQIQRIIEMFTYYAHPEYIGGGLFFKYPEYFIINFRHPEYLFRIKPSVLKDIQVNYHSTGRPAYVRDADGTGIPAPAEVELSLTFMETEIITKNGLNPERIPNITSVPTQRESAGPVPITDNGPTFTPGA